MEADGSWIRWMPSETVGFRTDRASGGRARGKASDQRRTRRSQPRPTTTRGEAAWRDVHVYVHEGACLASVQVKKKGVTLNIFMRGCTSALSTFRQRKGTTLEHLLCGGEGRVDGLLRQQLGEGVDMDEHAGGHGRQKSGVVGVRP